MKKIISFEGIDGCGKTTQINLLYNFLIENKIDTEILREPGGTYISEKIRDILLDNKNSICPESETLLFLTARSVITQEVILPSLNKNNVILCDRFIDSTLAYQGYGRKIDLNLIEKFNLFATNNILPDLTLIFDVNPKLAFERINKNSIDRMESSGEKFLTDVRMGYLEIAKNNPNRCKLIDCNNKDINSIKEIVFDLVSGIIK